MVHRISHNHYVKFLLVFRSSTKVRSRLDSKWLDSYKRTPFAVLVSNSFVNITSYLDDYGSRLKVHYFVINNSRLDSKFDN